MAKSRTILIWHNNGEQQFTFTVNPERLRVSRPNCNRVERLAMGGTVNLWGGRGLRGRILRGELTVRGDLRYRCGAMVELHRKEFGLDGAYPLTAVKHRWERGLFTTELTWEGEA